MNVHIHWVDHLRLFAIVCVVAYHVLGLFDSPLCLAPGRLIESFNMALFVFLSGYVGYDSLTARSTGLRQAGCLLVREFMRLMFPAIVCMLVESAVLRFTSGGRAPGFWFLTLMFILRAETIMAGCLLRSPALASVRMPLTFALMLAVNIFADKANAAELTGYYLAGALAFRHAAAFRLRTSMVLAVSVLLLLCFAVLHACGTYASFYLFPLRPLSSDTHLSLFFWRQLQAYAFIIPAILLSGRFLNSPANRFSRQTLGIYIVHETIMTVALRPFVLIHDAGLWSWPVFMLMSVALLSVTFFIVHLSSKSRVMRVAVLGKWKSD